MRSSSSMLFQIFGVNAHSQFPRLLHSYHAAYSWRWRCHFLCDTFNCQLSYIFCLRLDFMAAGTLPDRCCPGCTVLSISKWYSPGRQPSPVKTSGYSSSIWSLVRASTETSVMLTPSGRFMFLVTNPRFSLTSAERSGSCLASTIWKESLRKEPLQHRTKSFLPLGVIVCLGKVWVWYCSSLSVELHLAWHHMHLWSSSHCMWPLCRWGKISLWNWSCQPGSGY